MVAAALAAAAPATPARTPILNRPLARYLAGVTAPIHRYRDLLRRLEALLTEEPRVNVDPLVERLYGLCDRFEELGVEWQSLAAPRGLRVRHDGMGRVFALFRDAYRIHAAAIFTRHPDEILASRPQVGARLRSAAYLQRRWAAALRGALIRGKLPVPRWLAQMGTA